MKQEEMPGQNDKEVPCVEHPMAPHGFDRNASHNAGHYVCECQGWFNEMLDDIIQDEEIILDKMKIAFATDYILKRKQEHIDFLKGLEL